MITCPWCGTNYAAFQPNCKNCGGPLPLPPKPGAIDPAETPAPPPAPRPIANSYAWKLVFSDGWFITGMVFGVLGVVFSCVGLGLVFVFLLLGAIFVLLGVPFLGAGVAALAWRYQRARKTVQVLQVGAAARGEIVAVEQNYNVEVNGRHPWKITYRFQAMGRSLDGEVTTLNVPGPQLQPGRTIWALYLPEAPENNVIYPHP